MRDSPFREHKLEFASYLHGQSGGILLSKMAKAGDLSKDEVLSLLSEVRPLEFYMPVDRDRERWTGTADLVVVSLLDDDGGESPVGFDLEGHAVTLSADHPPEAPVMSLVPVETDFSEPLATASVRNVDRTQGQAVGVYEPLKPSLLVGGDCGPYALQECDPGGGSGGGGFNWTDVPHGIYLTFSYLDDLGESWPKGDPEIEIHMLAPGSSVDDNADDLQCAGATLAAPDYFDQNDHIFKSNALTLGSDGNPPRLASQTRLDRLDGDFGTAKGPILYIVEDDDTSCEIKTHHDFFQSLIDAASAVKNGRDAVRKGDVLDRSVNGVNAITDLLAASVVGTFINTNDELLGQIVESQCVASDGTTTGFEVRRGSALHGCVELKSN